jgi:hypothetical protein
VHFWMKCVHFLDEVCICVTIYGRVVGYLYHNKKKKIEKEKKYIIK